VDELVAHRRENGGAVALPKLSEDDHAVGECLWCAKSHGV
jgi:hypothetical protein